MPLIIGSLFSMAVRYPTIGKIESSVLCDVVQHFPDGEELHRSADFYVAVTLISDHFNGDWDAGKARRGSTLLRRLQRKREERFTPGT